MSEIFIMKRLIIGGLSILLFSVATTPAVKAEPTAINLPMQQSTSKSTFGLTPFQLVSLAYSGYFRSQGIPGYSALISAYREGEINAKDLVQSAVKTNRLSAQVLTDQEYRWAVQNQLHNRLTNRR